MPSQKNLKKTALFCFSVVILLFTSSISEVAAPDWWTVRLLVAYDEEFESTARLCYAYSPETLARIIIDEVEYWFMKEF